MCVTYMGTSKLTHNTPKVIHNTPKVIPQGTPKNRQGAGDPQVTHSDPRILRKRPQSTPRVTPESPPKWHQSTLEYPRSDQRVSPK